MAKKIMQPIKPPYRPKNGMCCPNVDSVQDGDIIKDNITLEYTLLDVQSGTVTKSKLNHFHDIEVRDFRKGCKDPCHTYTLVYGATRLIKRKGEQYVDDFCWLSVGCKGSDYKPTAVVLEAHIKNYGRYNFWETGVTDQAQQHRFVKGCKFNPEEMVRFNKDMATLFRVLKKNPK